MKGFNHEKENPAFLKERCTYWIGKIRRKIDKIEEDVYAGCDNQKLIRYISILSRFLG